MKTAKPRVDKKIVYTIVDNGVDGMAPSDVIYASTSADMRDRTFDADKNKAFLRKAEQIVDFVAAKEDALAKLDGIDKLVLDVRPKPENPRGDK
jgi:hypothetical protein